MKDTIDIVLVDDDRSMTDALHIALRIRGHAIRTAHCVSTGLAKIGERLPDLVICDLNLGVESGVTLLQTVALRHPKVRRMLITAEAHTKWAPLVQSGVAGAALSKPFDLNGFFDLVENPWPPVTSSA